MIIYMHINEYKGKVKEIFFNLFFQFDLSSFVSRGSRFFFPNVIDDDKTKSKKKKTFSFQHACSCLNGSYIRPETVKVHAGVPYTYQCIMLFFPPLLSTFIFTPGS